MNQDVLGVPKTTGVQFRRLPVPLLRIGVMALLAICLGAQNSTAQQMVCDVSADFALGTENYPDAIRLHKQVLQHDPSNALAHYHLGFAYGVGGDQEHELDEYLRAEELGLRQWDFFLNLGLLRLERRELHPAIDALSKAVVLGPRHAEAHFNLGLAYERAGLLSHAIDEISVSLKLDPDQLEAENELAAVYAEMGNYDQARVVWTKLVRIHPDYQPALTNLAILERVAADSALHARLVQVPVLQFAMNESTPGQHAHRHHVLEDRRGLSNPMPLRG